MSARSAGDLAAELRTIYRRRFEKTAAYRNRVWQVLTREFFSRWVKPSDAVLDLGCGYGEFINNIAAAAKFGMDLNPDARARLAADVQLFEQDCSTDWPLAPESLDVVFTSNFFEHLPNKDSLRLTLQQAHRCLREGGRLIAMGPNIKFLAGRYWDFFDHHVALTEQSLAEALETVGFRVEYIAPRFLPYTLVGGPEYPVAALRAYLRMPWAWPVTGRQFLVVGCKQ